MADNNDFARDDYNENKYPQRETAQTDLTADEQLEFERRQRSAKRESTKRQRTEKKLARLELIEEEYSGRTKGTDRRAQEKRIKRKYAELKRIADNLAIKSTLQSLSKAVTYDCWGPDVASDKSRPSIGIFMNYTDRPIELVAANDSSTQWTPKLFGAWLHLPNQSLDQVYVVIGIKTSQEDSQEERSQPPPQETRLLTIPYLESAHSEIQAQVKTALLEWTP